MLRYGRVKCGEISRISESKPRQTTDDVHFSRQYFQ